jgi:hypothetical protein
MRTSSWTHDRVKQQLYQDLVLNVATILDGLEEALARRVGQQWLCPVWPLVAVH